jgi:hypothetical protein
LDEVIDGKRTGKRLTIKLMVQLHGHLVIRWHLMLWWLHVVSTKDFVNQMATTLVGVKEWALLHDKEVISILKHIQLLTK